MVVVPPVERFRPDYLFRIAPGSTGNLLLAAPRLDDEGRPPVVQVAGVPTVCGTLSV